MGMFLQNIAIKTLNKNRVVSLFKEYNLPGYISSSGDWIMLFPEIIGEEDDSSMNTFLLSTTDELQTIATKAFIHDSDDLFFQLYDKGKLVFDYVVDSLTGEGIAVKEGSAEILIKYAQKEISLEEIEDILKLEDSDKYVFVEERYRDIIAFLGMPKGLGNWSYGYIGGGENDPVLRKTFKEELPDVKQI